MSVFEWNSNTVDNILLQGDNKYRNSAFESGLIPRERYYFIYYQCVKRRKLCRVASALEKQIQLICNASIKILCSDVLRTLGLIRELKEFKFEHAALELDFKGSLSLGHTVL